jgi:HAD superfamily hydrolase (TIGR01509 family)
MAAEVFIFDLFGVLISFDNDIVPSRLARHCADPADALVRLDGLMAARDVITGKSTLAQIHRQLVNRQGLTLSFPEFEAAWLEPYSEAMPGMAELVLALSAHYKLALLSNVDRYYWDVVQAMHPELKHFGTILLSCDLGLAKPDPEIFLLASRAVGASPQQCYFVDDTRVNVDAAAALGFQTHWFRGVARLNVELVRANALGV